MAKRKPRKPADPTSIGHEKLAALKLGPSRIGHEIGVPRQLVARWLAGSTTPRPKHQALLRGRYGIGHAEWERRPTPKGEPAGLDPELELPPAEVLDADDLAALQGTLAEVRKVRVAAQGEGSLTAAASCLAQETRLVCKIAEVREARRTERERLRSCPMLRGWYREAVAILRPALGEDWASVYDRIMAACDAVRDDGALAPDFDAEKTHEPT